MTDIMDITDEVKNLSESDRSNILNSIEKVSFSPTPDISIDSNELSAVSGSDESIDVIISNILNQYNEKYGTNYKYEDYKQSLLTAATINSNEREIRRLIDGQIITSVTEILTTKSILIISKVISDQLDRIAKISNSSGFSGELLSVVNEMFKWIEQLELIKVKFQKYDADGRIKEILSNKSSTNLVRSPEQEQALNIIKSLLMK